MDLTNESYLILIHLKGGSERYFREGSGWVKVSTRGRRFPATAEQVLNHLLPALAGVKPGLAVEVQHRPGEAKGGPD
jgi:hypothetical protein